MAFSRDDLVAYESKPQVQVESHDPWSPSQADVKAPIETPLLVEAEVAADPSLADTTVPTESGDNDGSTTETKAEPVAAEIANPEGAKDPELETEPADGRNRSRAQERIEELVAERNALRKYGEYLLKQVEGTRNTPVKTETESQPAAAAVEEDVAPTLESAGFDPVKLNTLTNEWIKKQVDKGIDKAVKQIEVRQSEVATRQAFEARTVEFRKTAPDFEVVIGNPALPVLASDAAKVIFSSDNGPEVLYHLGKNPDLAARISRMSNSNQAAAIGRLEEQLIQAKANTKTVSKEPSNTTTPVKQANVTKAPPPPKPVSGGSAVVKDVGAPMSMDEWVANERGRKIAERQARQKLRLAMR